VNPVTPSYPVNLVLTGRRCVIVGGGRSILGRARELVECGASVEVVAPGLDPDIADALDAMGAVVRHDRPYRAGDLDGADLVLCGREDRALAETVAADAEAEGALINVNDEPDLCSFIFPARLRQGPVVVTFSTSGASPAVASWLRRRYETEFGPEYAQLVELLSAERAELRTSGRSTEGLDWQGALDSGMLDLIREGRLAEAKERLQACLSSSSD